MSVIDIAEARERLRKKREENEDVGPRYGGYIFRIPETEDFLYRFVVDAPNVTELIILGNTDDPSAFVDVEVRTDYANDGILFFDVKMKNPIVNHMIQFFPDDDVVECMLFVTRLGIMPSTEEEPHQIWEWLAGWFATD